jgi:DNA polymerase delta subunit 1
VLNGRQLALKISANSVYGFTGAQVGQLPCLAISSSVTSFGRDMIHHVKSWVEKRYTVANGYKHDAQVIYGDTDSVMIKWGCKTVKEAMDLGYEAAEAVSKEFKNPIKLEFEKVYYPYLLMNKKRYAGLYWTNPDKYDKLDAKGIETVRRDNCRLVSDMVQTCLDMILMDQNVEGALAHAKQAISDLLCNRMDLSLLVISKALGKTADSGDYKAKQAHVELAVRMKQRDPGSAPQVGDRVPYIIIKGARGDPNYKKAEDPMYVLDNNVPIDYTYYLENQLKAPLTRIFEPILGENKIKSLFAGEHTRTVKVSTHAAGGLMKFAVKARTCVGCKSVLKTSERTVCSYCEVNKPALYIAQMNTVREFESTYARLWTECQRCQGSLHQDVLCSNRDCPIFYRRKKVQKDVKEAQDKLDRFSW